MHDFAHLIGPLARSFLGEPNDKLSSITELRFRSRGSMSVDLEKGTWYDHEVGKGGGVLALVERQKGLKGKKATDWLKTQGYLHEPPPQPKISGGARKAKSKPLNIVATYDYTDENGALLFQVCRLEPKDFRQRKPDGNGWSWSTKGVRRVPYRLPELDKSNAVFIVEGEKDVDHLLELGVPATTNAGGAGNWKPELNEYFRDCDVVVVPDRDPPGQDHAQAVADVLQGYAKRVRILELWQSWPEMPPKADITDWLDNGGTAEQLHALLVEPEVEVEPEVKDDPAPEPDDERSPAEVEVQRLARLSMLDFELARKAAAEALDVRASKLDTLVQAERVRLGLDGGDDGRRMQGRAVELPEPKPSDGDPVDGARLLDEIVKAIKTYIVLSDDAARSCAVWTLYTFLAEHFLISPRLCISSPVMGCGKSTLTDIISRLVLRPLKASNATAAAIFRVVEMHKPCLLIDEGDTFVELNEELRGILNSGHRHDGTVLRVVGEDLEPRQFATFSPCSIALIGELPPTLADRSILVGLKRRRPADGDVASFSIDETGHLDLLARQSARFAQDHAVQIAATKPEMPDGIINRARDNWRVLKAIATVVGGEWPGYIDAAALAAQASTGEETSQLEQLLSDINKVAAFDAEGEVRSAELVQALIELEGRPWAEMGKSGKPLTQNRLARILKPLGIGPDYVGEEHARARGYRLDQFSEAFERYLAVSKCAGVQNVDKPGTSSISEVCSPDDGCTDEKSRKPNNDGPLHTCTVANGGSGDQREVCAHCGRPGDLVQVAVGDRPSALLHRECIDPFGQDHGPPAFRVVGRTRPGTVCIACNLRDGEVLKIASPVPGSKSEPLHQACARGWFAD